MPATDCAAKQKDAKSSLSDYFTSALADVRMHDLRHSFASLLVNAGRTLYEVQHILGHTQVKTTQRYAHLSQDTLLAATNAATLAVGSVMGAMPNRVLGVPLVIAST